MTPVLTKTPKRRAADYRIGFFLVVLISILVLLEASFVNLMPLSVAYFVDVVIPSRELDAIYPVMAVLAGGLALAILAGLLREILTARAVSRLAGSLRRRVFDWLQQSSLSSGPSEPNADLPEEFSIDCREIERAWRFAVPRGVLPGMIAIVSSVLLAAVAWRSGSAALLLWPCVLLTPRAMGVRVAKAGPLRDEDETRLLTAMEENFAARPVLRAFSLERTAFNIFRKRNDALIRSSTRVGVAQALVERLTGAGALAIQVFVFCLSMRLAAVQAMTVGSVVAVQMLAVILGYALLALSDYLPEREDAKAALGRVEEIVAAPGGPKDGHDARVLPPLETEIGFSGVCFRYDEAAKRNQIASLTARIPKGAFVAFVGPNGCGKSTLARLLMRFHDPSEGRITIDGYDLKSVTRASLRARIGMVLAENPVFSMTLGENIRIGRADASNEAIIEAARAVGLDDMIRALPQGYNAPAGAGGVRLPPPLAQRLAIARVILRNPDILLLDETTSLLEPADELIVDDVLRRLGKGRTAIAMSRRLAVTAGADHIFMMEDGKIVEQGDHAGLLAAEGPYAKLWRKQAGFRFSSDGRHADVDAARLGAFPIFEKLTEEKLAEIAPYFATETFQPGRDVVRQNDPGDRFYIVARGEAEVWSTEEHSDQAIKVAVLEEGDCFGEIALITEFPRTATVTALTVCTCISLERGQFHRMLERSPELLKEMSNAALKRLRESVHAAAAVIQ